MKLEIWKYALPTRGKVALDIPIGATLLTVQTQAETPVLWVRCNPANQTAPWRFSVRLTGEEFAPDGGEYVGTFQLGWFVGHVFSHGNGPEQR